MSETPKTSKLLGEILNRDGVLGQVNAPEEWVTLCRELERENARLKSELAEWMRCAEARLQEMQRLREQLEARG